MKEHVGPWCDLCQRNTTTYYDQDDDECCNECGTMIGMTFEVDKGIIDGVPVVEVDSFEELEPPAWEDFGM